MLCLSHRGWRLHSLRRMKLSIVGLGGSEDCIETAEETTVGELKQSIHKKYGVAPMLQSLVLGEVKLESDIQTLTECGIHDGASLTLFKSARVYSKIKSKDECTVEVSGARDGDTNREEGGLRIEFRPDGTFLLVSDDDNTRDNNSGSGGYSWDVLDKFDVAVGTFVTDQNGTTVHCNFVKHFQRSLKESGSLGERPLRRGKYSTIDESIDSGWSEMDQVASLKWQRLELSDPVWEPMKVEDAVTGGGTMLGIPIKQTASKLLRGEGSYESADFASAAVDEVVRLIGSDMVIS